MKTIFLALSAIISFGTFTNATASTAANYPERCDQAITKLKGSGNYKVICAEIQTAEAYRCLDTVVSSDYIQNAWGLGIDFRLGRSTFFACGDVTPQAIGVVEQLLQKHPDASSDLIRVIGRSTSKYQISCFARVVQDDRADVNEDNILAICPN